MPKTKAEKETLKEFKTEYGPKKGKEVYYAKRNKSKKFDRSQGGGFASKKAILAKAQWIVDRLNKLPDANKVDFIKAIIENQLEIQQIAKAGPKVIYAVKKVHPGLNDKPMILVMYDSLDEAKSACMDSYANPNSNMSANLDDFRAN